MTPTTEVPIQVEAGDDFGVTRLGISYKVGDGPEETLHLADFKDQPVTAEGWSRSTSRSTSSLSRMRSPTTRSSRTTIRRSRTASSRSCGSSTSFRTSKNIRLVEGEGTCSGSSTTLEELIARQRVNLNRTFALERDQIGRRRNRPAAGHV